MIGEVGGIGLLIRRSLAAGPVVMSALAASGAQACDDSGYIVVAVAFGDLNAKTYVTGKFIVEVSQCGH